MFDPGITVVVVNYRTPDDLDKFLTSVHHHGHKPSKVIIANVAPQQADLDVAQKWRKKPLEALSVTFKDNVGYAVAANEAAQYGNHETIAIFNADVELLPGSLDACHQALKSNPTWGILGPYQVNRNGRVTHAGIFGSLERPEHRGWLFPDTRAFGDIRRAVTVSGAAYFVKRQVWTELTTCPTYRKVAPDALGAFLPTPFYYEETACSYHAHAHGWEVVYFGHAKMIHDWHNSVIQNDAEGWAGQCREISQALFRDFCDAHGIGHN